MNQAQKHCIICGSKFNATNAWHKYCSKPCKSKSYRDSHRPAKSRRCKQCGTSFTLQAGQGNKQHCSEDCSKKSARESRSKFWEKHGTKKAKKYYENNKRKHGKDSNLKRFYKRYPDAPKACQSCKEDRVLDIAHKPGHERNGAWRSVKNTTIEKVWILCPTCHALLDRKGYSPKQLGLEGGDANA